LFLRDAVNDGGFIDVVEIPVQLRSANDAARAKLIAQGLEDPGLRPNPPPPQPIGAAIGKHHSQLVAEYSGGLAVRKK
jgi:hypothetical protein